jgi:hypothetical protein
MLEAAREAEVDALLLTDHDTLGARRDGWEGLHDGVFLMVGGDCGRTLRLPRPADLTVRRDGTAIHVGHSAQLDLDIADRGAYRVEVRIDGGFWLLSNPIHLR